MGGRLVRGGMGVKVLRVILAGILFAGCTAPAAPVAPGVGADAAASDADGAGPMNLWLLEGPRPFTQTISTGAEPSIMVSKDGTAIFISDQIAVYRSLNNGATWTRLSNPMIETVFVQIQDGVALAEDDAGRIYIADTNGPIVGVASSADKGTTWDIQSKVTEVGAIVDRPWLAANGDGNVYLITNTLRGQQREECAHSEDAGQTWLDRSIVNAATPNPGNAVLDSRGRLWFSNGGTLWKWSAPCGNNRVPIDQPDQGPQILTQVGIDSSDRIYIAQPSTDSTKMMLVGYLGTGSAFRSIALSPPDLRSNTFGAISVDGDEIAVSWYGSESPGDPSNGNFNGAWNVFVARLSAADFWANDPPTLAYDRLTTEPNHVGGFCMNGVTCTGDRDLLDYFGVDHAPDGTVHIAYGHDGATSNAEVRYARLAP